MSDTPDGCPIAVIKLGGSVLTDVEAYQRCAKFLLERRAREPQTRFCVVVSAQLGETDRLQELARSVHAAPAQRALDLLWSTGELRSVALLTLALQQAGVNAAGLNVHECGLESYDPVPHADNARFSSLRLRYYLNRHPIVVLPGFLARGPLDAVATLGRGASDLTAVLLAATLRAERCELIKDVPGYFTADPKLDPHAQHVERLTFAAAIAFAAEGCDLVQSAALESARRQAVRLVIRGLIEGQPETIVDDEHENNATPTAGDETRATA